MNFKQKEQGKEILLDCARRFKLSREIVTSHAGGPLVLSEHVDEMHSSRGRGTVADQELIDDADDRLAA